MCLYLSGKTVRHINSDIVTRDVPIFSQKVALQTTDTNMCFIHIHWVEFEYSLVCVSFLVCLCETLIFPNTFDCIQLYIWYTFLTQDKLFHVVSRLLTSWLWPWPSDARWLDAGVWCFTKTSCPNQSHLCVVYVLVVCLYHSAGASLILTKTADTSFLNNQTISMLQWYDLDLWPWPSCNLYLFCKYEKEWFLILKSLSIMSIHNF